jgi:hypothetical protein
MDIVIGFWVFAGLVIAAGVQRWLASRRKEKRERELLEIARNREGRP